jgi:hypothetical protein
VLVAYVGIASFPDLMEPVVPGLDPSWRYAINRIGSLGLRYGRDVVFTYGPLGYLILPRDVGVNLVSAIAVWAAIQAGTAALILSFYRWSRSVAALAGFSVVFLAALSRELGVYRALLPLAMLLAVDPRTRTWRVAAPPAGVGAAALLFASLSGGAAATAMVAAAAIVWLFRGEVPVRRVVWLVAVPYVVALAAIGGWTIGGPLDVVRWFWRSLDLARGYAESMSYPGPVHLVVLAALSWVAVAVIVLVLRRDLRVAVVGTAVLAGAAVAFRHSVVRGHGQALPGLLLGGLGVLLLVAGSPRVRTAVAGACVLVAGLLIPSAVTAECYCPLRLAYLGPVRGWENLSAVVHLNRSRRRLDRSSVEALAADRLPPDWVAEIRTRRRVDVIPSEIVVTVANQLAWQPNPVIQTYAAVTEELDRRVAAHFAGLRGPGSLVVEWFDIDARHPMLGAPATWRSILGHYRLARREDVHLVQGPAFLLARRETPVDLRLEPAGETTARVGAWTSLPPPSDGLLFASLRFRKDFGGALATLVWRIDPVFVDLRLADGGVVTARMLPATAPNGLLLDPLPLDENEFLRLLSDGTTTRRVVRFRIHGPGTGAFEPTFRVVWRRARWVP